MTHSGPLPAPEQLARYDEIVPGGGKMIFDEFQAQSKHRRSMERLVVTGDLIRSLLGLFCGAGIGVYMIWAGTRLLQQGHSVVGFSTIAAAVVIAAGPFLARQRIMAVERERQEAALRKR